MLTSSLERTGFNGVGAPIRSQAIRTVTTAQRFLYAKVKWGDDLRDMEVDNGGGNRMVDNHYYF